MVTSPKEAVSMDRGRSQYLDSGDSHDLSQGIKVKVSTVSHVDSRDPPYDERRSALYLCGLPPPKPLPQSNHEPLGQIPAERHLPKYLPRPFSLPRSLKISQSERPSQTGGAKETGQGSAMWDLGQKKDRR